MSSIKVAYPNGSGRGHARNNSPPDAPVAKGKNILEGYEVKLVRVKKTDGKFNGLGTEYYGGDHDGYSLSCNWVDDKKNGDGVLWNAESEVILEGQFMNNILDGFVKIYNPTTGKVIFQGDCKNGKWCGRVVEFNESGATVFDGEYLDGLRHGSGIENGKPGTWMNGVRLAGRKHLERNPTGTGVKEALVEMNEADMVVYRGSFNRSNYARDGVGCEYDSDSGELVCECEYANGEKLRVLKRFMGNHMDEYNQNSKLVYSGLYSGDFWTGFTRNTIGIEYDPESGSILFSGSYKDGKPADMKANPSQLRSELAEIRKERLALDARSAGSNEYSSLKTKWSERVTALKSDVTQVQEVINEMEGEIGKFVVVLAMPTSHPLHRFVDSKTGVLTAGADGGPKVNDISLIRIRGLSEFVVKDHVFEDVRNVRVEGCTDLKATRIGTSSFTQCTYFRRDTPWNEDVRARIASENRAVVFSNLPSLEIIDIGHRSFVDFVKFDVNACDRLKTITIGGQTSGYCDNFYWCKYVSFANLPSLQSIILTGDSVFNNCNKFTLEGLPALTTFKITNNMILQAANTDKGVIILSNLPYVRNVAMGPDQSVGMSNVTFYKFSTIKRGQLVNDVLYNAIRDYIKLNGEYKTSLVEETF